jgi:hypothetical protein
MRHQFSCGTFNADGTWTMPADLAARWLRLMITRYSALDEQERSGDEAEADRTLETIDGHLLKCILMHGRKL